jgi:transposase InsO family protein
MSAEPRETQTLAQTTDETDASPEQFADHQPDRAQLTTRDNALAETTIGLYKHEAVRDDSPFRRGPLHRLTDVELLTADWVHWYNTDRLMHRLGRIPPIEYEAIYYATNTAPSEAAHQ